MAFEPLPEPIAVALDFAAILERLGIPYVIGGSLASSVHGEPRSTLDVDLVADLAPAHVGPLVAALQGDYYVDAGVVREAVRTAGPFNAIHRRQALKVDVFVAGDDALEAERQSVDVLGILRVQGPRLDAGRLRLWAERLGVSDLLRRPLDQTARD